jgi:hypothetical protein
VPSRRFRSVRPFLLAFVLAATSVVAGTAAAQEERTYEQHPPIVIESNRDFDGDHGVRSGKGTVDDPYVISGWQLNRLVIRDTSKHVLIYDNQVAGQLILNYAGGGIHVHENTVGDLRVNQNVPRTGQPTGGVIADNAFGIVGQLRHWNGVFENNRVITATSRKAAQLDGFHGGIYRNNVFYGYVDLKLHGHHHGSCFDCASHDHREATEGRHSRRSEPRQNHALRYHQVFFMDNEIHSTHNYALRYDDLNHAANDRTNASETDPALEKRHLHFTRVFMTGNRLVGAGLEVNVFNALDRNHTSYRQGLIVIQDNLIELGDDFDETVGGRDGIAIHKAQVVTIQVLDNVIEAPGTSDIEKITERLIGINLPAGIRLGQISRARVFLYDNSVSDRHYGIEARRMDASVLWYIRGLQTTRVNERVFYDNSVENDPERTP